MTRLKHTRIIIVFLAFAMTCIWPESARPQSFVAMYSTPKTQQFAQFNENLQRNQTLEQMAAALSQGISLNVLNNQPVTLTIAECGSENAYFDPQQRVIVLCYELIGQVTQGIQRDFARISSPKEIADIIGGGLTFVFVHELGHALISLLDLPVLGREEDAADQISAFFMLQSEQAPYALAGALWFFRSNTFFYTRRHFSDEHSLGPQRQSNLACLAFGKDSNRYQYLIAGKYLTKERAPRCKSEYQQLDSSVRKLLGGSVHLSTQ